MLLLLLSLSPFVAFLLLVFMSVHMMATGTRRPARSWAEGAVISACLAYLTYAWGSFHKFTFPEAGETCSSAVSAVSGRQTGLGEFLGVEYGLFPLKAECKWAGGGSFDLVPAYVNPLLYTFLAAVVACVAAALYFRLRGSRVPTKKESGSGE